MGKKDAKLKAAEKKIRTAAKQDKKAKQKEKKTKSKGKDADSDGEDVDLEAVLTEFAKQQEQFLKVTESPCEPPPPRSSSTLIASPSNSNELFLFGGEYYNGALATFYNDLFVYQINKAEWRKVTSPNSPLPRSGHAWTRGGNAGGVWLFGGEFSSPKQGTFYHYNDFWSLDPASREWTRVETKGKGPPARSGHRMTYFKNYIILFGGFQDTSQTTKYLSDLWLYDTATFTWHNPTLPPAAQKPDPRSSFSFLPHPAGAVLFGGYSRVKATAPTSKAKVKSSGGGNSSRIVLKPLVHQDTWVLKLTPPAPEAAASAPPAIRWERRKKPVNSPNPPRAGATMAFHKARGLCFGGVHDVEESEEGIDSEFFNNLFAWNIERNRFFPLGLRKAKAPGKKAVQDKGGRRGRGKADEEELLRNLAALETRGALEGGEKVELDGEGEDLEDLEEKKELAVLDAFPHPRFNAQLAVQEDTLFIYGGTYEAGDREFTFDEMFAINLIRMDGVKVVFQRELENWVGSEDEDSEDDDEGEDDEDDDEDERDANEDKLEADDAQSTAPSTTATATSDSADTAATELDIEPEQESRADDLRPYPRPFESLKDFFQRTGEAWQEMLLEELRAKEATATATIKELRKKAFEMAEDRWWDCREEITALEDEQEEAGIGEVVSLKDKESGPGTGGVGRRR